MPMQPHDTSILIAQPTTGSVVSGTVGYLAELFLALSGRGIEWGYKNLALSDIALSRNIFASHVIADNEFSHVLFIDADMGFQSASILGLIDLAKPVTALACPKRFVSWDRVRRIAAAEEVRPPEQRRPTSALMDIALDYNVATTRFDGSEWQARRDGKFLSVPAVGTGVMLVHRDVFEIMLARDVAHPRPGHDGLPLLEGAPYCDFFSPLEVADGSMIESEDISFCKRWVDECQGEIWVDIDSRVMHYGMRGHSGRYLPRALADFPEINQ